MHNNYEKAIANRYEFVLLYDVENGNPNGDPDAGNMPRIDPETGHGIVTDVCIKRKIRNCVLARHDGEQGFDIYVRQDAVLNIQDKVGLDAIEGVDKKEKKKRSVNFRETMCNTFFDVRAFGAVMTTAASDKTLLNSAGQVRGPVQLAFGKSIEPIMPREITITRVAVTKDDEKSGAMGRKAVIPYALYRQEGYISANLARTVTGFSNDDLEILWQALIHMFDDDRSAARGKMALRELVIFKHESVHGNAPAHKLFERVSVQRKSDVPCARSYADYALDINDNNLPEGVEIIRKYRDDA